MTRVEFCIYPAWWRHQVEIFSASLAICAGNSPVSGEFPAQRPVTRSFDIFFDLCLNKRLSKQSRGWWFETLYRPLWRHCNGSILEGLTTLCYTVTVYEICATSNVHLSSQLRITRFATIHVINLFQNQTNISIAVPCPLHHFNHLYVITDSGDRL